MIKYYCDTNSRLFVVVGDGFNDFPMQKDADLPVGILSPEILQVRNTCNVMVIDFSQIAELILVYGNFRKILKIRLNLNYILNLLFVLNNLMLNLYYLFIITFDIPVERALITLNYNI